MTTVSTLRPYLWQLSLPFQGTHDVIGPYLLAGNNELAIIDPGPESTARALLERIQEAGFSPQEVSHILLTHIHLDHAGGVGMLLQHMPKAEVCVHSTGAPHLIETGKLIASATRIYGEKMGELWGKIEPVPADRVHALDGGDILHVAGRRLEVHYTPGHAIHHVVFFDAHSGELFTGDATGVQLPDVDYVRPPTPPPDLDIEAWFNSIDLIKKLRPDLLYLAHYGPAKNPPHVLENLRASLITWGELVLGAMRDHKNEAEITELLRTTTEAELLRRAGNDPTITRRYDLGSNYPMTVQGYIRYWLKRHPERCS